MKILIGLIILLFCAVNIASAQSSNDSIFMTTGFWNHQYYQNGERVSFNHVGKQIKPNEEAFSYIKKARGNMVLGTVLGGAGGFLVGYHLGLSTGGEKLNTNMLIAGIGLIALSIPLNNQFRKNTQTAIDIYNSKLQVPSSGIKPQLSIGLSNFGLGLKLSF